MAVSCQTKVVMLSSCAAFEKFGAAALCVNVRVGMKNRIIFLQTYRWLQLSNYCEWTPFYSAQLQIAPAMFQRVLAVALVK